MADQREHARQTKNYRVLAWDIDGERWVIVFWHAVAAEWSTDFVGEFPETGADHYDDADLEDFRELPPAPPKFKRSRPDVT